MISERKTSYITYDNKSVPFIRISGKWLEKIGFNIGSKYQLRISDNGITLIPITSTSPNTSANNENIKS